MIEARPKILLIDDEEMLLTLYSVKFKHAGYDVFIAKSVAEADAALEKGYMPDVILFDINMPYQSGFEFIEHVGMDRRFRHALKIAFTNEVQDAEIARTKELGADMHLVKAKYTPKELVTLVSAELVKRGIHLPTPTDVK